MQGGATQAMSMDIVEERQRSRCLHGCLNHSLENVYTQVMFGKHWFVCKCNDNPAFN
jgi:hypothetical protein